MLTVTETGYGYRVSIMMRFGEFVYSFVKKEGAKKTYELGSSTGPHVENPRERRYYDLSAALALRHKGLAVVV